MERIIKDGSEKFAINPTALYKTADGKVALEVGLGEKSNVQ